MKLFAEIVATSLLPGVRAMLALELTGKYNLTQAKAAEKLGLTQAAISQYRREIRGYNVSILKKDEHVMADIRGLAERLKSSEVSNEQLLDDIYRICILAKERGLLGKFSGEVLLDH